MADVGFIPNKVVSSTQQDASAYYIQDISDGEVVTSYKDYTTVTHSNIPCCPLITPKIITFNIGSAVYQGIEGITWERWVASAWNTGGFTVSGSTILASDGSTVFGQTPTTVINGGAAYTKA